MDIQAMELCDRAELMRRTMGDENFCREIVLTFLGSIHEKLENLSTAIVELDCEQICFYVHSIKGSAGNLALHRLYQSALSMEQLVRSGDLEGGCRKLPELRGISEDTEVVLREILGL